MCEGLQCLALRSIHSLKVARSWVEVLLVNQTYLKVTEIAQCLTEGNFILDTAYSIVNQWSIRSYFIEPQWNVPYPLGKWLTKGTTQSLYWLNKYDETNVISKLVCKKLWKPWPFLVETAHIYLYHFQRHGAHNTYPEEGCQWKSMRGLTFTCFTYICLSPGMFISDLWGHQRRKSPNYINWLYFQQIIIKNTQFGENCVLFHQKEYTDFFFQKIGMKKVKFSLSGRQIHVQLINSQNCTWMSGRHIHVQFWLLTNFNY